MRDVRSWTKENLKACAPSTHAPLRVLPVSRIVGFRIGKEFLQQRIPEQRVPTAGVQMAPNCRGIFWLHVKQLNHSLLSNFKARPTCFFTAPLRVGEEDL